MPLNSATSVVHLVRTLVTAFSGLVGSAVGGSLDLISGAVLRTVAGHLVPAFLDALLGILSLVLDFLSEWFLKRIL